MNRHGSSMLIEAARRARNLALVHRRRGTGPAGTPLPPLALRMGGVHFRNDTAFVSSAVDEIRRLETHGLRQESRLLDWGCGAGRLAVGIAESWGTINLYHGVDVQKPLVRWGQRHLAQPTIKFTHVDVANVRYNPNGQPVCAIPGDSSDYDAFYAYSVFSHMDSRDSAAYLLEARRLLRPGGFAFVTAFVERDVPPETQNPTGYGPMSWSGPLHCVRFSLDFWETLLVDAGLTVEVFEQGGETDGQSLFILRNA